MWSAIQWLVVRIAAIRWLFKLGWLGTLIPIVLLLKGIGLPVLIVLAIVAIPALFLLLLFGLPIFLVLLLGGALMGLLGVVLTLGVAALKFAIFVVLPIWLIWKISCGLFRWVFKRNGNTDGPASDVPPSDGPLSDVPPSTTDSTAGPSSDGSDGIDPLN
jgi:hypothetical protein